MTNIEAMKLALDALEEKYLNGDLTGIDGLKAIDAMAALRQAISEAEQVEQRSDSERMEPVAWMNPLNGVVIDAKRKIQIGEGNGYPNFSEPLYTAPPKAEQEPVAAYKDAPRVIYLQTGCDDPEDCECSFNEWGDTTWCTDKIHDTDIPYIREDYTAPPKKPWVILTDDEILGVVYKDYGKRMSPTEIARAIEAKLKEKNYGKN